MNSNQEFSFRVVMAPIVKKIKEYAQKNGTNPTHIFLTRKEENTLQMSDGISELTIGSARDNFSAGIQGMRIIWDAKTFMVGTVIGKSFDDGTIGSYEAVMFNVDEVRKGPVRYSEHIHNKYISSSAYGSLDSQQIEDLIALELSNLY